MTRLNRRIFLQQTAAAAALISTQRARAADLKPLEAEIAKRHDEAVQRLQNWIRQPAIAAENRGMTEGCELMMRMLRDAGFDQRPEGPDRTDIPECSRRSMRGRRGRWGSISCTT